ncbi:uncharacterized protein [Argopecten irradians]|uniref:uncharacterized protein isoform X2 n=1 Tax=Argopecten irradians TaxID=31199 RepID=UPI00371B6D04
MGDRGYYLPVMFAEGRHNNHRQETIFKMRLMSIAFLLLSFVNVYDVSATAIDVLQLSNGTCVYEVHYMNKYTNIHVEWDGRELPSSCRISFLGQSSAEPSSRFKMCVTAWLYDIVDCNFTMNYYNGFDSVPSQEYACYDGVPPTFCADEDTNLEIEFKANSTSVSSLELHMKARLTYTPDDKYKKDHTLTYIGLAIALVVVITIVAVYLFFRYISKRNKQGVLIEPASRYMENESADSPSQQTQPDANHPQPEKIGILNSKTDPPSDYSETSKHPLSV